MVEAEDSASTHAAAWTARVASTCLGSMPFTWSASALALAGWWRLRNAAIACSAASADQPAAPHPIDRQLPGARK